MGQIAERDEGLEWGGGAGHGVLLASGAEARSLLLRPRVERILFAATKADHLHHAQHGRLTAITDALLTQAGSSREKMLRVTIWLADMSDFAGLNEVWNAWVPEGHAPARACGEAKLARAELKVEMIVDAAYD